MNNDIESKGTIKTSQIIFNHMIKYDALKYMTDACFAGTNYESVNIYIDLYQIVLKLFRRNIQLAGKHSLASLILNLCAHYRFFYRKYYGVSTKIFIIYTNDKMFYNTSLYPEYNSHNDANFRYNFGIVEHIAENTDILNIISRYFTDVFFIQSSYEPSAMILNTVEYESTKGNNNPNIILSTSLLHFQIPAFTDNPTYVYYHQYSFDGLHVDIISKNNQIAKYLEYTLNSKNNNIIEKAKHLNPQMLGLIIALSSFKSRDVKSLLRLPQIINGLYDAISKDIIFNAYTSDMNYLYQIFNSKLKDISINVLDNRFKALDVLANKIAYEFSTAGQDKSWDINLKDPDRIKAMNTRYFNNYPIDVERL